LPDIEVALGGGESNVLVIQTFVFRGGGAEFFFERADGAEDPAGDFCRRFGIWDIFALQESFHETRLKVWKQQPDSFFDQAVIEADGTQVETWGEHKEGMSINHKGQWGYHPLVVTLANTREVLYLWNRPGNRPSHERLALLRSEHRTVSTCRLPKARDAR
jgi:hypothetical protein